MSWRSMVRAFDILNSRNCRGKGLKASVSKRNLWQTLGFLSKAKKELQSLQDMTSAPLYLSRRKIGKVGFLVDIDSVSWLARSLVMCDEIPCSFLLAYKFSQDHLGSQWAQLQSNVQAIQSDLSEVTFPL